MSVVNVKAWQCDFADCGHVWYSKKEPARCSRCKRNNWNKFIPEPRRIGKKATKPIVEVIGTFGTAETIMNADGVVTGITILNGGPSTAPGWEKPLAIIPPPQRSERFQEVIESIVEPKHKVGEKCPHGWANWMQCDKCNGRKQ
jgi:hypothetical protein